MNYPSMIVDSDHKDTVADVECIHVLLEGSNGFCPEDMRPCFVPKICLEASVQTLQEQEEIIPLPIASDL